MMKVMSLNPWIRQARFDLTFITGGAFFTLFVAMLSFQFRSALPVFFWIWVVAFEGSHFWATLSRTYFDSKFRSENTPLLLGSLVFFVFPLVAIVFDPSGSSAVLYGFFIFLWSLYHNVRQHYGFLSLYCSKISLSQTKKAFLSLALYGSVVCAQLYFLLSFKLIKGWGITQFANSHSSFIALALKCFSALALAYLLFQSFLLFKEKKQQALPVVNYLGVCWLFYTLMFFYIAPRDLLFQDPSGLQKLMLITIMNSLFHNIQYHGIVWHYAQDRYTKQDLGWATLFNSKISSYLFSALTMGAVFGVIVWHVGDWPSITGSFQKVQAYKWAYVLFFGIIGHHFYLDQKIWRPSKQKDLKKHLLNTGGVQ